MRGLLYKEFHQFKVDFYVLIGLLILLFGIFIPGAVMTEAENPEEYVRSAVMLSGLVYFLALFLGSILCAELFTKDEKRPWHSFAMSLPMGAKGQVQAKYYAVLLVHLMVLFVCFLADAVVVLLTGNVQCTAITVGVVVFCFRILVMAFEMPFMFRFGAQMGTNVEGAFFTIVIILGLLYGLFGDISFFLQEDVWKAILEWLMSGSVIWVLALLPYVTAIAYYVSYRISLKQYRKGVEYGEQ